VRHLDLLAAVIGVGPVATVASGRRPGAFLRTVLLGRLGTIVVSRR
jgi:hypothetical protein